jgi:large subunit ribosomal protein L6
LSRIGRLPVVIPTGVSVEIKGLDVRIKGPKGDMVRTFHPKISISEEPGNIIVQRSDETIVSRSLHGTTRALLQNMVTGVSTGFTKVLEIEGVGYRAEMDGEKLVINVGYSHPVVVEPPTGIVFTVDVKARQIKISGSDKEQVGQVAADLRKIRPPEPYKGKGIHYLGEKIRRKAGKSGKTK